VVKIEEKFIVNLKGKQFVTYEGLLDLAHQNKLKSIKTELIQIPTKENNNQCIMKAIATTEDGKEFEGYGDADTSNVNSMISKHIIRMAETRAKARALRDLTNVGMTALEELGDEEVDESVHRSSSNTQSNTRQAKVSNIDKDKQAIVDNSLASDKQLNYIYKLAKQKNYSPESMASYIKEVYGKDSSKALTKKEANELIEMLKEMAKEG
jgi:hypothetical protein